MKIKLIAVSSMIIGAFIGILFTAIAINLSTGNMMLKEIKSPYDFEKTVEVLTQRINSQPAWHVVTVIDQNAEVQKHGGKPIGKFNIVQFCSDKYSSEMLGNDNRKKIGAMLPKTFAVYEKSDGQVYLSTSNGMVMGKLFGGETEEIIERVSLEVESILRFVNFKFSIF
ncbi:MAG: DUF302 domain-containing protein [bacterium]